MDSMPLSRAKLNSPVRVELVADSPAKARLESLGIVPGAVIEPLFTAACGSPTAYSVRGTVIAIRRTDAETVSVSRLWE